MARRVTNPEETPKEEEQILEEEVVEAEELPAPEPEEEEEEEEYDSRKMDPNETVWDGGPNFGQINAWKDEFGEVYVTSVTPEVHYVWRPINRFEYRRLVKSMEQAVSSGQVSQAQANLDNEEAITETCTLYPVYRRTEQVSTLAGVASTLSEEILDASGFRALDVRKL